MGDHLLNQLVFGNGFAKRLATVSITDRLFKAAFHYTHRPGRYRITGIIKAGHSDFKAFTLFSQPVALRNRNIGPC